MLNELYCDNRILVFEYKDSGKDLMCVFNKENNKLYLSDKKDFFYSLLTWETNLTLDNKINITYFFKYSKCLFED